MQVDNTAVRGLGRQFQQIPAWYKLEFGQKDLGV